MKKYKVHFSLFNLFNETQAEVERLRLLFKGVSAAFVAAIWENQDLDHAKWYALAGFVIDMALGCLYFEKTD